MITYKLKYDSKELGVKDLKYKGVLIESENGLIENENVLGVVYIGNIVDVEGYHIDVACKIDCYKFGLNETHPINPKHKFA